MNAPFEPGRRTNMRSIVIATANRGKFEEIKRFLGGAFDRFFSLAEFDRRIEVVEDMPTYFENALKKARKIGNHYGMNALADDSGLEVEALQGRPGIYSARYAANDEERIEKLLRRARRHPPRGAQGGLQGLPGIL